jgi:diguanylate cyclase (GGDEF)-like protein
LSDKYTELGIPQHEISPAVSIAVSGLLHQIEHLNNELGQTRLSMEMLQSMVDAEGDVTLPSRKAFISRLNWSIAMHKRYAGKVTVVVFRINDFEEISRSFGTQAINRTVKLVAEFISSSIRDTDYFARIGKDEFGALMYFAEYSDVLAKAQSLVGQLRGMPIKWGNSTINLAVSVGAHLVEVADAPESAILAASNASYIYAEKKKFEEINFKA